MLARGLQSSPDAGEPTLNVSGAERELCSQLMLGETARLAPEGGEKQLGGWAWLCKSRQCASLARRGEISSPWLWELGKCCQFRAVLQGKVPGAKLQVPVSSLLRWLKHQMETISAPSGTYPLTNS